MHEEVGLWCDACGRFFSVVDYAEGEVCEECEQGTLVPYDPGIDNDD